jgi:c-di-GMP-binding flagellar brake protein YcgR
VAKRKGTLVDQKAAPTAETSASERRDTGRISAHLEVEVPVPNLDQLRRAVTDNISPGGLMFLVESPVTLPAVVDVTLVLPGDQRVVLSSEIRHAAPRPGSNQIEVGIQFKDLDAGARKQLEAALSALER